MPLTSISVSTNLQEFSRFEADRSIVTVYLELTGTSLTGEQVRVEIRRSDYDRGTIKAYKVATSDIDDSGSISTTFDLNLIVSEDDIPLMRRGAYYIYAYSATDDSVNASSADFLVSLITTDNFRSSYLHGTDQR